jgi:hypothetical protein
MEIPILVSCELMGRAGRAHEHAILAFLEIGEHPIEYMTCRATGHGAIT